MFKLPNGTKQAANAANVRGKAVFFLFLLVFVVVVFKLSLRSVIALSLIDVNISN